MLVGDEDGRNIFPSQPCLAQPDCELPHAQAAIHQQAACAQPVAAFNQGRVTGAAAAQVFQSQHGRRFGVCIKKAPQPCGELAGHVRRRA